MYTNARYANENNDSILVDTVEGGQKCIPVNEHNRDFQAITYGLIETDPDSEKQVVVQEPLEIAPY